MKDHINPVPQHHGGKGHCGKELRGPSSRYLLALKSLPPPHPLQEISPDTHWLCKVKWTPKKCRHSSEEKTVSAGNQTTVVQSKANELRRVLSSPCRSHIEGTQLKKLIATPEYNCTACKFFTQTEAFLITGKSLIRRKTISRRLLWNNHL